MIRQAALVAAAAATAAVLTRMARAWSIRRGWFDRPTDHSSHSDPTPRLGGVGIVTSAVTVAAVGTRAGVWEVDGALLAGAVGSALLMAVVGLIDDLRSLPPWGKLLGQLAALLPATLAWSTSAVPLVLGAGVLVWVIAYTNIFNFMDGSDGLAAGIAIISGVAFAGLAVEAGAPRLAWLSLILSASTLGFFRYNYPPATIFMGDAGSLFLGYSFAALGVALIGAGVSTGAIALALMPFLFDGSFTLLRRAARRERVWHAHRSHLYQRLLRAGRTHRDVALGYFLWAGYSGVLALVFNVARPSQSGGWRGWG